MEFIIDQKSYYVEIEEPKIDLKRLTVNLIGLQFALKIKVTSNEEFGKNFNIRLSYPKVFNTPLELGIINEWCIGSHESAKYWTKEKIRECQSIINYIDDNPREFVRTLFADYKINNIDNKQISILDLLDQFWKETD